MTQKERVELLFRGKKPDVMPFMTDLCYWRDSHTIIGDIPKEWLGEDGEVRMYCDLNAGYYVPGDTAFDIKYSGGVVTYSKKEGDIRVDVWKTPVGEIRKVDQYSEVSYSWAPIEYPIKHLCDLEVLDYIVTHMEYIENYERLKKLSTLFGNYGLIVAALPRTPLTALMHDWYGVENFVYVFADYRDRIFETMNLIEKGIIRAIEISADAPCSFIMVCDNLSAETIVPYFDIYMKDFYNKYFPILKPSKKILCHIDGTLKGLLSKLTFTPIDCPEAVTPFPVGDLRIENLRNDFNEEKFIWGGLPGAMFSAPFKWDDIQRQIDKIIECYLDSGKFILGVADEVPPDADINIVRKISDYMERNARY